MDPVRCARYPFVGPPVVVLGPPFTIGDEEIERIGKALESAIASAVDRARGEAG
jgi:adenosylmethionine-8-amino-7-oxononanoate aminotransferase